MSDVRKRSSAPQPNGDGIPWLIVAGGFHADGGMDRANAALARYLIRQGASLHLVAHRVADDIAAHAQVTTHLASRPCGSFLLGEAQLHRLGLQVARQLTLRKPRAHVVVNGGNCAWPNVNWVHCVHRAWPCQDRQAPAWFRLKNRLGKWQARRRERRAIGAARLVLANSERTRRDLVQLLDIPSDRIHTVYLGADAAAAPVSPQERAVAKAQLGEAAQKPLVVFVGAISHDDNKGLDVLWSAWQRLCARPDWDVNLLAAGGGNGLSAWRWRVERAGLARRFRLLGFVQPIADLYRAADLLVSPVRYEAFGLNVQEAICHGMPALVSRTAGVAEHYTADLAEFLLPDAADALDLADRLLAWRGRLEECRQKIAPLGAALRKYTWDHMAARIVSLVEMAEPRQPVLSRS